MKILKISHKAIMIFEASYIYCKRHNIDLDPETFITDVYVPSTDPVMDKEIDNMCKDLRSFRHSSFDYELRHITVEEYEMCCDYFNK